MNWKQFLKSKSLSEEDYAAKSVEEMAQLQAEFNDAVSKELNSKIDKAATKADLDAIKTELEGLSKTAEVAKLQKDVAEALEGLAQLKEKGGMTDVKKTFSEAFKDVQSDISDLVKGVRTKEVVIKADTVRASIATSNSQLVLPGIGQLGTKVRGLYNIFRKVPVTNGDHGGKVTYTDWDEATSVRAAEMTAEGGTFPESTAKFKSYSTHLVKIGDTLPVSEEFGEDQVSAAAELEMFIDTNVQTKIDSEIANGTGTAGNIKGLIAHAPAYTAPASGMVAANIYDLVKKVKTDITKNRGSKYNPDFVAMNSDTLDSLQLTKDANENYVFPDKSNIGSMIIVEDNNIADNVLVVGDSRYGRIYEMGGIAISRGLKGDQFVEDMETIKARKRLLFLIRNVDLTGFRKVDSISAALTLLET